MYLNVENQNRNLDALYCRKAKVTESFELDVYSSIVSCHNVRKLLIQDLDSLKASRHHWVKKQYAKCLRIGWHISSAFCILASHSFFFSTSDLLFFGVGNLLINMHWGTTWLTICVGQFRITDQSWNWVEI